MQYEGRIHSQILIDNPDHYPMLVEGIRKMLGMSETGPGRYRQIRSRRSNWEQNGSNICMLERKGEPMV